MSDRDSSHGAATLLPELLDQIFSEVENAPQCYKPVCSRPIRDDHLVVCNTRYSPGCNTIIEDDNAILCPPPKFRILPLIRMCKWWRPVAERRLYQSIVIRTARYPNPVDILLRTLEGNPRLAGLVRELRMVEPVHQGPAHTQTLAGIISACTQLSYLTLIGFVASKLALKRLQTSLSSLSSLRSLVLVQHDRWKGFNNTSHFGLCSAEEILQWMTQWPDIEHVVVLTGAKLPPEWRTGRFSQNSLPSNNQFPCLRTFSFLQPTTSSAPIQALKMAAPRLETLRIDLEATSDWDIRDALATWAPTLHTLHLYHSTQLVFEPQLGDLLGQLSKLRSLHTTSCLIPPEILHRCATLEMLDYTIETLAHVDGLIEAVPQLLKLVDLKVPTSPIEAEVSAKMRHLQEICYGRKIEFVDCVRSTPDRYSRRLNSWDDSDSDDESWRDYVTDSDGYYYSSD
ncbi:hypothetical protein BDY19DRAFT_350599 [Irpex rosettiformis]|uniref:Uncharacterized protein n=1 Tax=Irpex rosettiformis TaxID=378272 RepID=A0ACB8TX42_9APHY|nr:hypothetical protein BDY19DRAFT_350599 [Irpex rosettiformis]